MYYLISGVFRLGLGILNCFFVKEIYVLGGFKDWILWVLLFKDYGFYCIFVMVFCVLIYS